VTVSIVRGLAGLRCQSGVLLFATVLSMIQPSLGMAQASKPSAKVEPEEELAKKEALSALSLLHQNQISRLYREKFSELQKNTGLTTEAKAVATFGPIVQMTPGAPLERTLLFSQRTQTLPLLFHDQKADFYSFVFLAKYPGGNFQEEVYMVKEKSEWKVAAIGIRNAV
jgi:hypothetical protein